jgi:hypothetical protein
MPVRKVGARVDLSGEKEYKNALSELNRGNRVLAAEMRKLQAEYRNNADSSEFLTKKSELLKRQLLQQKDKVETLRAAVQHAADTYGEAHEKTQEWIVKLNDAEAAQFDLEHAIEENNAALSGQNEKMLGLGDSVSALSSKFGIDLPDGAKKALNGVSGFSTGTVAKMSLVAAAIAAVIKAIKKLNEETLEAAARADDLLTQSSITGVSLELLQAWQYAAPLIDVSVDTIAGSLTKLTRSMADARAGNEATSETFARLGVAITNNDGSLRSAQDVFYDVIDALGRIENSTERDALAMDLLGKSAQDLNPLIEAGSAKLREYGDEAQKTGYVMSDAMVAALGDVDDAHQRLQLTLEASKNQLALQWAPASKEAMELFADVVKTAGDTLEKSGLLSNLADILASLLSILQAGVDIAKAIPGLDQGLTILKVSLGAVAELVALIADAADLIAGVMTLDWTRAKNALGFGYGSGNANHFQRTYMNLDGTLYDYDAMWSDPEKYGWTYDPNTGMYTGNWKPGNNAAGNENWRGGLTYLGENGPETAILPKGTEILSAQDTRSLGGDTFYITIDAKNVQEFNDIVELARDARVRRRMH